MDTGDEPERPPNPRPAAGAVVVDVSDDTERLDAADITRLRDGLEQAVAIAASERTGSHELRVLVVDDAAMGGLHEQHSGIAGTTDVLTFDLRERPELPLDVDVVVCLDEAVRAVTGRGHDVIAELTLYGLHGALHCLGYDDHDDASYAQMHAREDEILRAIGLGSAFFGEAP